MTNDPDAYLDSRSAKRTTRKRCAKCGRFSWARKTERKCKRRSFGRNSYACWGALAVVTRKATPLVKIPKGVGIGYVLSEEYQAQVRAAKISQFRARAATRRASALTRLELARAKAVRAERLVAKYQKLMTKWERIADAALRRYALGDDEIVATMERTRVATQVRVARGTIVKAAGKKTTLRRAKRR